MASWLEFRGDGLEERALGGGLFGGDVGAEGRGVAEGDEPGEGGFFDFRFSKRHHQITHTKLINATET